MSPKVKFTYFTVKGRGELIRLVLHAGGVDYEEDAINFDDWPKLKPYTTFGYLPLLTWDDEEIAESMTIARFVARKTGLAGDNDVEMARADQISDQVRDVYLKYIEARFAKEEAQKKQAVDKYVNEIWPTFVKNAEKLLKRNGGEYFSGNGLTYGDLALFLILDTMANAKEMKEGGFGDVHDDILKPLAGAKHLTKLHKAITAHPKIAQYLKERPAYSF